VATLNIKNLPDSLYRQLKARAKKDRRSVAQEVTGIIEEALREPEPLSIESLRGLGKDRWTKIDGAKHVDRERRSWD
jgi:plasmid stability protein